MALLQPHYHMNNNNDRPEMNRSKQSVKECNPSLLLMFDSHHQTMAVIRPIDSPFTSAEVKSSFISTAITGKIQLISRTEINPQFNKPTLTIPWQQTELTTMLP